MVEKIGATFAVLEVPFDEIAKVKNDGSTDGKCSVSGPIGSFYMDMFLDYWMKHGHNCSVIGCPTYGHFSDTNSVKGVMAHKSADASLAFTTIFESNPDHIEYSVPVYDDHVQWICSYNYTEVSEDSDLIDTYFELHWSYYAALVGLSLFFIFVWRTFSDFSGKLSHEIKEIIRRKNLPSYWLMLSALLDQDQFPDVSLVSFSFLTMLVSSFYFIFLYAFMLNMVRSDLVVIEEPAVIRSYQDAFDRKGLKILFFDGWEEEGLYRFGPKGSWESKIWEKRFVVNDLSADTIGQIWMPIQSQKMVLLARDWLGLAAANLGLTKTREMGMTQIRALVSKDELEKKFTNALMIQKDAHPILKETFRIQTNRLSQSGIVRWFVQEKLPEIFGGSLLNLERFVSSKLFLPEVPEPIIKLTSIRKCYYIYSGLLLISLVVLIYEILDYQLSQWQEDVVWQTYYDGHRMRRRAVKRRRGIVGFIKHFRKKLFKIICCNSQL